MTIPFLDLYKKLASRFRAAHPEGISEQTTARVARVKKPESERLSKTVLPNAIRSFSAPDPFRSAAGATLPRGSAPLELGARGIKMPSPRAESSHLPPALARALEPKLERTISLRIVDFIDRVSAGYIKPVEILDANALVSLKASEIEKGMSERNPTISLPSLYQQVPEIFLRSVRPDDDARVELPYEKVLEQFQTVHVRTDQVREAAVPQLDTPILKATLQDSERFGTKIEPLEASSLPPVGVEPATAESIAAAEPEAVAQEPARPTSKTTASGHPVISLYSPELQSKSEPPPAPTEIPFEIAPNGTGASASGRVPASSGPPVPNPLPFLPELAKIAFSPPIEKPKASPIETPRAPTKAKPEPLPLIPEPTPAPAKVETVITLSVKAVLKNLPAFQLNGDVAIVHEEERLMLPLALIEKQLPSGRISITPDVFREALPEKHRGLFQTDEVKTPVALPLEEVLKNLPATILKLRDDQEEFRVDKDFETPFSLKAKEDAQRFAPTKPAPGKISEKAAESAIAQAKIDIAPAAPEEKINPKEVVAQACALRGVKACAITFSDGLSLAGELPGIAAEGLSAMAPALLERMGHHLRETKLGSLEAITLYASGGALSFFAKANICLTALHATGSLSPQTRRQIAELVEKLSRTYAQPENPHVDY